MNPHLLILIRISPPFLLFFIGLNIYLVTADYLYYLTVISV